MSTLNKSLPKASNIRFADADRKNHHTLVYMPLGGAIQPESSLVCWQQNSYTYGFQAQYRVRARLTPENAEQVGATTKATAWKHIVPSWNQNTSIDKVDQLIYPNSASKWFVYKDFDFAGMDFSEVGGFDKLEIDLRVRSFSKSKKQHGSWTTGTITVKCRPVVSFSEIVAFHGGGLRFYFDLGGWTRGGSWFKLKSVKRAGDGTELLKAEARDEIDGIGDEENKEWPYAGFLGKHFNAAFAPGEAIRIEGEFETCDGVIIPITGDYSVSGTVATVGTPNAEAVVDEDAATLAVTISKSNPSEDWDDVSAWIMCGEERIDPCTVEIGENEARIFSFMPPLDRSMDLYANVENDLKSKPYNL